MPALGLLQDIAFIAFAATESDKSYKRAVNLIGRPKVAVSLDTQHAMIDASGFIAYIALPPWFLEEFCWCCQ